MATPTRAPVPTAPTAPNRKAPAPLVYSPSNIGLASAIKAGMVSMRPHDETIARAGINTIVNQALTVMFEQMSQRNPGYFKAPKPVAET